MSLPRMTSNSRLKIIVTGLVCLHPVGGVAWDYLQYVIGLAKLGHDVYYYEDTSSWPYNPKEQRVTDEPSYSLNFIFNFFKKYAPVLNNNWCYIHLNDTAYGMSYQQFEKVSQDCDLFINVSGANPLPKKLSNHCVKIFLDTDPGYNQIVLSEKPEWELKVDHWIDLVESHDSYFTYAENIYGDDCRVPKLGLKWYTTRMPIVLSLWEDLIENNLNNYSEVPWTTVMSWNAFKGPLTYQGIEYGSKGKEFEKIISLPKITGIPMLLAVGGISSSQTWLHKKGYHRAYRLLSKMSQTRKYRDLHNNGWEVVDGPTATITPDVYKTFIAQSRGEISTAKNVYTALKTGWFSCRSACYLASGKPVVVQDTGFTAKIPSGAGMIAFSSVNEAADAIVEVENNYAFHSKSALQLANEYFDSNRVLGKFIADAFGS